MIQFVKYHGAGNDFVMIDGTTLLVQPREVQIRNICSRHFGIGADGLIILRPSTEIDVDFDMEYFNSDGRESTMCGNGARCAVAFAREIGLSGDNAVFTAIDGLHRGVILPDGRVTISMSDVTDVERREDLVFILNTGSPHYVEFVNDLEQVDARVRGRAIRNSPEFIHEGINVNFVQVSGDNSLCIRTYERGVEDLTLACGTGVTAAVLAFAQRTATSESSVRVLADGGELTVGFRRNGAGYTNVNLTGPVERVFEGSIRVQRELS